MPPFLAGEITGSCVVRYELPARHRGTEETRPGSIRAIDIEIGVVMKSLFVSAGMALFGCSTLGLTLRVGCGSSLTKQGMPHTDQA